jgi:hypothetical protein
VVAVEAAPATCVDKYPDDSTATDKINCEAVAADSTQLVDDIACLGQFREVDGAVEACTYAAAVVAR